MQEDGQRHWISWPDWFRLLVVDGNPLRDISVLTAQGESIKYVFQRREVVSQRGRAVPK